MKYLYFFVFSLLLLASCSEINPLNVKTITISSMDTYQEISDTVPVRIIVSGMNSEIKVLPGTQVNEIVISGMNSVVYLPEGVNPKTTISGVNSKIEYYS